jgi:hypothetical protein
MSGGWHAGYSALLLAIALFFLTIVLMAHSFMHQHWQIHDLQKRIGTVEQHCQ